MDLLEDFFARKKLYETAIEVSSIEETMTIDSPAPPVILVIKKGEIKPRKLPRRPALHRAKMLMKSDRQWLEWVLIPIAVGQFWWLALLSLPALSAQTQCSDYLSRNLIQVSVELIRESFKL
ncbi:hypothetical protein [Leptolyngbya sp. NIES-2104]|uniref:hypothetical protein n=1 Tax=Leptolyngbya sp. NIES-2104 TaxID=1552121 RepID=UPI0006EC79BB|nr:hypothetical protein [Leptolyngbya sp. NIES-2104]GAP99233.1 hypothetical protein NIES2104_57940 [Leptolyngbya sp. NIES-2104]